MDEQIGRVLGDVLPRRMVTDLAPLLAEHRPDAVIHIAYEEVRAAAGRLAEEIAAMPAPQEVARRLPEIAGGDD